jgi:hypothetical protein
MAMAVNRELQLRSSTTITLPSILTGGAILEFSTAWSAIRKETTKPLPVDLEISTEGRLELQSGSK